MYFWIVKTNFCELDRTVNFIIRFKIKKYSKEMLEITRQRYLQLLNYNKNRLSSTLLAIAAIDKIKEKFAKEEFNDLANEIS